MVLMLSSILLVLVRSISISDCIIFFSSETPPSLIPYFTTQNTVFLDSTSINIESINTFISAKPLIAIDATFSQTFIPFINFFSDSYDISYITLTRDLSFNSNRISLHRSYISEASVLDTLLTYYNLTNFVIITSGELEDMKIAEELKTLKALKNHNLIIFYDGISESKASDIVKKTIKVKGLTKIVIIDKTQGIEIIQKALEIQKIVKEGLFLLYSSQSIPQDFIEGSIFVKEFGLENAKSLAEYHYFAIENCLNYINSNFPKSKEILDSDGMKEILWKYSQRSVEYSLLNAYNGRLSYVGNVAKVENIEENENFTIKIDEIIYFPGNTTGINDKSEVKLTFSIANGENEIFYLYKAPEIAYSYKGAEYAVSQINDKKLIPGFYIETFPTDCGMFIYEPFWYKNCFSSIYNKLGIAYITSFFGGGLKGNYLTLKDYGLTIPQISPLGALSGLDNITEYPQLFKFEENLDNFIYTWLLIFQSFGFKEIAVIGSFREDFNLYPYFLKGIERNGFKIANPEDYRVIPVNYTRDNFDEYKDFFIKIKETRCNAFFITCLYPEMVVEALYDVGLRKGDFFFISTVDTVFRYFVNVQEPYLTKRKELLIGSLAVTQYEWVGDLGHEIRETLSKKYQNINNMCLTYDTVLVIREAILYLLAKGEDYEDPLKLIRTIRNNKVIGCVGSIYFSKETTGRTSSQYLLSQVFYDESSNNTYFDDIAHLDRFSDQIITVIGDFEWPGGNKIPNFRPKSSCSFDSFMAFSSEKGRMVLYIICSFCFLINLVLFIFTVFKGKLYIELLTQESYMTFDDMVYFAYFPFQFFQMLVLGPDQKAYKYLLKNFQILLSLNYELFFNVEYEIFWQVFTFNFILAILWIFFSIVYILKLDYRYNKFFSFLGINRIFRNVVPIIGHIGYLPLVSMLMSIYLCLDGISDDLQSSFMTQDCTTFCYKGKHLSFIIFTTIILFSFITISTLTRPYWEKTSAFLNLRTSPVYLSALSLTQIVLIILNKALKTYDQIYHGIACSIVVSLILIFTLISRPYNYQRALVSQIISLSATLWGIATSTFFLKYSTIKNWLIVEATGILGIIVVGVYFINRCPKLLKTENGVSIAELFLFQFSKNYHEHPRTFADMNIYSVPQAYVIDKE